MQDRSTKINRLTFVVVCAVPIFCILAYGTVHQPILAIFYLLMTAVTLLWIGDSMREGIVRISTSALQLPLLFFAIYGFTQTIPFGYAVESDSGLALGRTISVDPYGTLLTAVHIVFLIIYFGAALIYIDRRPRVNTVTGLITTFGLVYSFYAIIQSILSPDKIYGIYEPGSATPFGSFVNRHNFAAVIEMAIAVPLAILFTGAVKKHKKLLYWVATGLMATALLLSGSRGGLVSLIVGLVFLSILTFRIKGRPSAVVSGVLTAAIVFIALAGAIFVGGDTSLTRFTDESAGNNVSSSRTQIWAVTIDTIRASFPAGVGIGAFPQAYTKHDPGSGAQRVEQAHNDYLQVLADAGIAGMGIGIWFLYLFFREGSKILRQGDPVLRAAGIGAFTGCFIILVHSLFDFVLHITAVSLMFLMLLALMVASRRINIVDEGEGQRGRKNRPKTASVSVLRP